MLWNLLTDRVAAPWEPYRRILVHLGFYNLVSNIIHVVDRNLCWNSVFHHFQQDTIFQLLNCLWRTGFYTVQFSSWKQKVLNYCKNGSIRNHDLKLGLCKVKNSRNQPWWINLMSWVVLVRNVHIIFFKGGLRADVISGNLVRLGRSHYIWTLNFNFPSSYWYLVKWSMPVIPMWLTLLFILFNNFNFIKVLYLYTYFKMSSKFQK